MAECSKVNTELTGTQLKAATKIKREKPLRMSLKMLD